MLMFFIELRMQMKGDATVRWTEKHTTGTGDKRRTETRTYSAHENYINFRVAMYGELM